MIFKRTNPSVTRRNATFATSAKIRLPFKVQLLNFLLL